jgi:hypothetical protein
METISKKTPVKIKSTDGSHKTMTGKEMVEKMLADQKIICHAIQNDISLTQLEKTHGFKFAPLSAINNK